MDLKANELELRLHEEEQYLQIQKDNLMEESRECWTSIKSSHLGLSV